MPGVLGLNCFVLGQSVHSIFRVDVNKTATVLDLKILIKNQPEKTHAFQRVEANSLDLQKASIIPIDHTFQRNVRKILDTEEPLSPVAQLSEVFSEQPEDEHLHIVIRPHPIVLHPNPPSKPQQQLQLNCLVLGDSVHHIFPVEIEGIKSVSILRKLIKKKKEHAFQNFDADTLRLWKVSIPVDHSFQQNVHKIPDTEEPLSPVTRLSKVFLEQPKDEHLHILVQNLAQPVEQKEARDIVTALYTGYEATLWSVLSGEVPSKLAKSAGYRAYQQQATPIYDGRYYHEHPVETKAPPIQLFHPVFGHFLDDVANDLPVPDEITTATVGYMRVVSGIYDSEDIRRPVVVLPLAQILGISGIGTVVNADITSPDGLIQDLLAGEICETIALLIKEDENEIGVRGSDPSTQASFSMARYWAQEEHKTVRENSCCPTFVFANAGPWFAVLGAVFTDRVIVQRLTDFIWAGLGSTLNELHCNRVAHIMHSLKRNIDKLRHYYFGLKIIKVGHKEAHPRFFPSIRAYSEDTGRVVDFKYIRPLELEATCVTFLAQTLGDSPKPVVVKFVQRYGVEAHRILAKENLAPQLFYFGKVGVRDGDPSYGPLRMVVMQYIEGTTLGHASKHGRVQIMAEGQVKLALKHLHNNGFVFGDLRPPNVMITKNKEVKLIDFDWAGVHKESRYPLLVSPDLTWPTGVEGLSVMETWHDDDMLTRLFS